MTVWGTPNQAREGYGRHNRGADQHAVAAAWGRVALVGTTPGAEGGAGWCVGSPPLVYPSTVAPPVLGRQCFLRSIPGHGAPESRPLPHPHSQERSSPRICPPSSKLDRTAPDGTDGLSDKAAQG